MYGGTLAYSYACRGPFMFERLTQRDLTLPKLLIMRFLGGEVTYRHPGTRSRFRIK